MATTGMDVTTELSVNVTSGYDNDTYTNKTVATIGGDSPLPHSLFVTIFLGVTASFVIIVTILGNILVLMSFVLERTIRQPTNYFIASLALSDLLIGTFSMPCFTLYLLLGKWPLGEIICDLWLSLDWTVCLASQYTVFFITADRFCSVKIPAKYRNWRTDKKVRIMIALSWIIPSLVFFTSIIGWQYFVGGRTVEEGTCEVQFMVDPLFTFLLTIGYFWTTLTVMIVLYIGIYRVALSLQQRANEKHKKMHHAMEMAKEKRNASGGAKAKESKKRVENNNARHLRGPNENNTITTSFSKNSDNEHSKPSEEDRSSSPAFASDDDDNSGEHQPVKKESCYVNSAVQTESTLKGMLGTSFNHMSRLAFSISGTSVSASQASQSCSEKDSTDEHQQAPPTREQSPFASNQNQTSMADQEKPLLSNAHHFSPISDIGVDGQENDNVDDNSKETIDREILDGLRYIDEDSLKSLTSSENVKLLAEIREMPGNNAHSNEADSPVWRKRVKDEDRSLLVPLACDSGSSDMLSKSHDSPRNMEQSGAVVQTRNSDHKCHKRKGNSRERSNNEHLEPNDHGSPVRKDRKPYGSPLQSLVRSLRPSNRDKSKKAPKSKSENRARKALRTISIILGAYVLCWTPYHVMVFIIGICRSWDCINIQVYYFTYWLCYLNSPINPFCYAFANAQFKRTFIRILKLDLHRT